MRKRNLSYTSGNRKPKKNSFYFRKWNFSYISGNGNPKKLFIFQENFRVQKLNKTNAKMFPLFRDMELSCHKLERRVYMHGSRVQYFKILYAKQFKTSSKLLPWTLTLKYYAQVSLIFTRKYCRTHHLKLLRT